MAEELITYGMVRGKGYAVSVTKQDSEYAIKQDFMEGGAVGLISTANLSKYESNELIENSSIPIYIPHFFVDSNKLGKLYMSNAVIGIASNPNNLVSRTVLPGLNRINFPTTVGTPSGGTATVSSGGTIYFYGDPLAPSGNTSFGNYAVYDKDVITITFPSGAPKPDPEPNNSMIINFSGVTSGYNYAFVTGTGTIAGDIPILLLANGATTFSIPIPTYNLDWNGPEYVDSGTVGIYKKPNSGGNWGLSATFSVYKGSSILVNLG